MNKKKYIIPGLTIVEIKNETPIATSNMVNGDSSLVINPNTMGEGSGGDAVKHRNDDDFDFGGGSSDDWSDGIW